MSTSIISEIPPKTGANSPSGAEVTAQAPDQSAPSSSCGDTHVLILSGGLSHERDVSIRSGRRVSQMLHSTGLRVSTADVDSGLLDTIADIQPDVIWPLLHGAAGEDGSLRSLLDLVDLPFVGSRAPGARIAWSKPISKSVVSRAGASTPGFTTFAQSLFRDVGAARVLDLIGAQFNFPLVVKPASGGSALGVSVVHSATQLPQAMVTAFAYNDVVMVEQHVEGIELAVSVVDMGRGPTALPAVEIATDGAYDYDARYNPGRSRYFVPGRLTAEQHETAESLALLAHETLGLRHFSRTDMFLTADGSAQFLEVNVAPGMTETSLFPQAAQASEYGLASLYRTLVEVALAGSSPPRR